MGRGDKSSRKGKIAAGSFGNRRPHKHHRRNKGVAGPAARVVARKNTAAQPTP